MRDSQNKLDCLVGKGAVTVLHYAHSDESVGEYSNADRRILRLTFSNAKVKALTTYNT